jgi:ABC-type Fe3+-hydroxamate transport system substrate-binding protein
MTTSVKDELLSKIQKSNDEILLKQISLMLDSNVVMQLNQQEKNALDEAFDAVKNKKVYSDDEVQKEWDKWIEQ